MIFISIALACCPGNKLALCAEETGGMVITQDDFPLRSGLFVEYSVKSTLEQIDDTTIEYRYVRRTEVGGTEFIKRVATMSDGTQHVVYFCRTDEGIVRVPSVSSSEKSLVLKLPLKVGESWVQEDFVGTRSMKMNKRAEMIETVATPVGKLRCIRVRQRKAGAMNTDEDSFIWVAREYGIVKIEINKRINDGTTVKTVMTMSRFEDAGEPDGKKGGD